MKIIGLDLGKFKSVACVHDTDSNKQVYLTVETNPQRFHQLLTNQAPDRLVFEVGTPAGWVRDLAESLQIPFEIVNTRDERWGWIAVKTKTDRTDAFKLVRLSVMNEIPQVIVPPRPERQHKRLIHYRSMLVKRRTEITNHIRALFEIEGLRLPSGRKAWSQAGRQAIAEYARPCAEDLPMEDAWRGILDHELKAYEEVQSHIKRIEARLEARNKSCPQAKRLQTIPGVGPRLSESIVAVLGDPHRFKSGKQVGAYVGLTARRRQSGEMDRSGRISKQGDRHLRSLLVEIAWISRRFNPEFKRLFEHLCGGHPKRRKKAAVALARRILVICWSMLKHGTNWDPTKVGPPCVGNSPLAMT